MNLTWDPDAKAVYIELPCDGERKTEKTVEVHGHEYVFLDYNKAHELLGIEILSVDSEPVIKRIGYPAI